MEHYADKCSRILSYSGHDDIDVQELLAISDILITDYSSCYFDFLLLNRPVTFYAYDLEDYRSNDRGFYYDYEAITAGPIVRDVNHLIIEIEKYLRDPTKDADKRKKKCEMFHKYRDGKSCERTFRTVEKLLHSKDRATSQMINENNI